MFQAKNINANLKRVPGKKIYGSLKSLAKTKTLQKRLQTRQDIIQIQFRTFGNAKSCVFMFLLFGFEFQIVIEKLLRIQKISRMNPQFAKLNGREKNLLAHSRKLIPMKKPGSQFSSHFFHKITRKQDFSLFFQYFGLRKCNFVKINSSEIN